MTLDLLLNGAFMTLFEQKRKKKEELDELMKLSNQVSTLTEEDVNYLNELQTWQRTHEKVHQLQEEEALSQFRQCAQSFTTPVLHTPTLLSSSTSSFQKQGTPKPSAWTTLVTPSKKRKPTGSPSLSSEPHPKKTKAHSSPRLFRQGEDIQTQVLEKWVVGGTGTTERATEKISPILERVGPSFNKINRELHSPTLSPVNHELGAHPNTSSMGSSSMTPKVLVDYPSESEDSNDDF
ncbi:hypothetical protein HMI54_003950 [Coelomomyces lativittatus]|nr:hypothetical protein HMI55_003373 [Coelomomyces lativittatus]KAJ1507662.1 hypothetical protein HMI54_003950 [Coelomomyces lativittatus]KAJ1508821.1 hypothetical protein HMI56_007091 [Coelomomyces lativittatus]